MKIQLGGLSEGIHRYRFRVVSDELNLGGQFRADVDVEAALDKTPTQILLTSKIRTTANFECDRCVAPFEEELSPSYKMLYVFEGSDTGHLDPSEFQVITPGNNVIDITEDVRQTILLSVPLKLLCNENCKGLCPSCGKNLNEGECFCKEELLDPRWEQLRKLQSN
ncbi:MAG: DUF177 domain-containing protein [Bacteroidota bacterium]